MQLLLLLDLEGLALHERRTLVLLLAHGVHLILLIHPEVGGV
jgi:hypothetical protein